VRATRIYLQMTEPGQFRPALGEFPDVMVERVADPAPALYRTCYHTVGAGFHWRDRWHWTDVEIAAHLTQSEISLHVARRGIALAGWYELRRVPDDRSVEVAYFGIVPTEFGKGFGKYLLSCAVRDAWALGPTRVWLHTCTLDHANALPNYVARGFAIYKTEEYDVAQR